jgi:nicotinamide mononucleotide transporter
MNAILEFLNSPIGLLFGMSTSAAELFGFATGAAAVYLVAKNNIWTWPVGIVNAVFFFVLFIEARLYTDAWLQLFFIGAGILGWYLWLKAGPNRTHLRVRRAPMWMLGVSAIGIIAFAYLMYPVLHEAHGAYPLPDATTTGLSVAAQIIMGFKYIQNWYLWIAADLIYIPVYALKGLWFTSVLYVVFLTICFIGLAHWRKVLDAQEEPATVPVEPAERAPVLFMTLHDET